MLRVCFVLFYKKKKWVRKGSTSHRGYNKVIAQKPFYSEILLFDVHKICNCCLKLVHVRIQLIGTVL